MKLRTRGDPFIPSTLRPHVRHPHVGFGSYMFTVFISADPVSLIDAIHARNMKAGVAISPDTPSAAISDEVGEFADMLLVMTVYPGKFSQLSLAFGQEHLQAVADRSSSSAVSPKSRSSVRDFLTRTLKWMGV
jgi:hypothetical protein